jgi:hypothetical protein
MIRGIYLVKIGVKDEQRIVRVVNLGRYHKTEAHSNHN